MKKQCEAITLASTYSESHRCLKKRGLRLTGQKQLCAHHQTMEARKQS